MFNTTAPLTPLARIKASSRRALTGAGCFAAVAAASAALSAPAMAATHCKAGTTTYSSSPVSVKLSGDLCYNGTQAWDPDPGATTLTCSVPWYWSWAVTCLGGYTGDYNTGSDNKGTEVVYGVEYVLDSIDEDAAVSAIVLDLECTPAGYCTSSTEAAAVPADATRSTSAARQLAVRELAART
ncbi:MAG: hypothetical protein ACLP01_24175 [Solirubrobacteraceae bacterium]